jgi:membrane protein implicated in regulation of membrane protease activity
VGKEFLEPGFGLVALPISFGSAAIMHDFYGGQWWLFVLVSALFVGLFRVAAVRAVKEHQEPQQFLRDA